jgi:hypothetical protein
VTAGRGGVAASVRRIYLAAWRGIVSRAQTAHERKLREVMKLNVIKQISSETNHFRRLGARRPGLCVENKKWARRSWLSAGENLCAREYLSRLVATRRRKSRGLITEGLGIIGICNKRRLVGIGVGSQGVVSRPHRRHGLSRAALFLSRHRLHGGSIGSASHKENLSSPRPPLHLVAHLRLCGSQASSLVTRRMFMSANISSFSERLGNPLSREGSR